MNQESAQENQAASRSTGEGRRPPLRLTVLLNGRGAQGRYRIGAAADWIWCEGVIDAALPVGTVIEVEVRERRKTFTVGRRRRAVLDFGGSRARTGFQMHPLARRTERSATSVESGYHILWNRTPYVPFLAV